MTINKIIEKWAHPLILQGVERVEFKQDLYDLVANSIVDTEEKFLDEFKSAMEEIYN